MSWIVDKVDGWEQVRDRGYALRWGEYWRMWRGYIAEEDRNRQSERSKIVTPALAQAIEQTVAELDEAIFSRENWFDLADDMADKNKADASVTRDQLLEDLEIVNAKDQISEAILNGAIFGTGIVLINVSVGKDSKPKRDVHTHKLEVESKDRTYVTLESVRPDEFIPDPAGKTIEEMLGVARKVQKPLHSVLEKIKRKVYRQDALQLLAPQQRQANYDIDADDPQSMLTAADSDEVTITEYHGKVPANLLTEIGTAKNALDALLDGDAVAGDELVEAIVTIANGNILLRAIPNPFVMKDRSFVAFQFEKVPGRFWGRGIAEKGYNPQKALDAEVRARIDALGFISAPMLGVDSGRIPKGFKLEVRPGKVWTTQGPPDEVLRPVSMGQIDGNTFNQASEMERMVQMGTGAFDTASALKSQSQSGASGLSSNSMLMGAFVKRSKRAIRTIDANLLTPLLKKVTWRYMQFDGMRYPTDYEFVVKATLGIMAREVETSQVTQLIGMMPAKFENVQGALAVGILENTSIQNKAQIVALAQQAMAPPPPEQAKKAQQLMDAQLAGEIAKAQGFIYENQLTLAQRQKTLAEAEAVLHKSGLDEATVQLEAARIRNELEDIKTYQVQNAIALSRLKLDTRELDQKDRELDIKQQVANKPTAKSK